MDKPTAEWDRHSILAALRRRNMTLTQLAEDNSRNAAAFRLIWSRPNATNERIIADFLGLPVEALFPERYPKRRARVLSHDSPRESTSAPGQRSAA